MKNKVSIRALLLLLGVFLSAVAGLHAQTYYHHDRSWDFILHGEVDSARSEIELQMKEPGSDKDPECWFLYGFVYKEMYKKYENTNMQSTYRIAAFNAFRTSIQLDTVSARMQSTRDNVKYLASRFYNDAVSTLDTVNYATSLNCYLLYRQAAVLADPKIDIQKKDIEFYLALASTYNTIYNLDKKKNVAFFDSTRNTYSRVLTWDANNYTANYNLGLLYWNKGVDLMYDIDYDDSLGMVFDVQDHSVELFKQSLPFAEKAYQMEPKREETLIVLSGIYYSLNDFERSKKYQEMLDKLRAQPK
jgi:hypothetical protein